MPSLREIFTGNGSSERSIKRELQAERWENEYLNESIAQLEDHLRDEGWRKLTSQMEQEFTRAGLDDLMTISRAMYLSHPLIQRAVNVRAYYTWGQGVVIKANDDDVQEQVIKPLTEDRGNRAELYSHQARILSDVDQSLDGNTFMAMFTDAKGDVKLRSIPNEQIRTIFTNPEDANEVWYYRRTWNESEVDKETGMAKSVTIKVALYPDWQYALNNPNLPLTLDGVEVRKDSPVIHQRTGGLKHWQFGMPETYAALDWARAYRKFLEDWHTIVASLARFAWRLTTKGKKVKRTKDRLQSTISEEGDPDRNPPGAAGGVALNVEGDDFAPIPKNSATTSADDARPSRMMVGAAMDLPDTILSGDADVGNHATAKTLDRPTELAIASRQQMWADFDRDICSYAIAMKERRGDLRVEDDSVSVSFPTILEHDAAETVKAIIAAATLEGKLEAGTIPRERLTRMLLEALGVEDVQEAIDDLNGEDRSELAQAMEKLAEVVAK